MTYQWLCWFIFTKSISQEKNKIRKKLTLLLTYPTWTV